jgi:adenylate cyclase
LVNAVACAAEIQRGMRARNADVPDDRRIEFRIGINLGDVIVEGDDIYGDGVNVAARLESVAQPGGICIAASVREQIGNRLGLAFEDIGEQTFKNIDRRVRVYSVVPEPPPAAPHAAYETAETTKPSIAVLPFTNMSGDAEQEYFSDGITEDIITDLSKISALFVPSRHSVFAFKGKPLKVQQIARELDARFILEGSVRKAGTRVRITAQLIDGGTGGHLWVERYDRELTDIFAIQDEITRAIVEQLKVRLLPEEKRALAQVATGNVEAYNYYLRGRQFLHRHSKPYLEMARRMFAKAVELDPHYGRAYAGIADCDANLFQHYHTEVAIESIFDMSGRALELDSSLAEAHTARGYALSATGRHEEAIAEYKRAVVLDPNLFEAYFYFAGDRFTEGSLAEAAPLFERAAEVKPDDYQCLVFLTSVYRSLGREEDTMSAAREGLKRAELELATHPDSARAAYLGAIALAYLGERERAKEWVSRALAIDPDDQVALYNIACVHAELGEIDQAFDALERAVAEASRFTRAWTLHDPAFDALRQHSRWQRVMELMAD